MKIGFCLMKDWLATKPRLVKTLDRLGYDGVEVWAQSFELLGIDGVKAALASYDLEVISVNPYFDFTSSEQTYEASLNMADKFIEYARQLGCSRIRTFTSKMNGFATADEAAPEQWERAINGISELCDRASPHGIHPVMEVHFGDGQLFDNSENTKRIVEAVARPNLMVNLQPPLRDETPLESAEKLGPLVQHLHAHNWLGGWGSFTYLDRGDVDFEAFLRKLRGHGFDGYICVEHASSNPFGFARHNIKYLRRLFEKLTQ